VSIERRAKRLSGGAGAGGRTAEWSGPRGHWYLAVVLAVLVAEAAIAVLGSDSDDWHPWSLVIALTGFTLLSELFALSAKGTPTRPLQSEVSSSAPYVLAMTLLGPAPTLAISALGVVADGVYRRKDVRRVFSNMDWCAVCVAGALLAQVLADRFDISSGEPGFVLLVVTVYAFALMLNLLTSVFVGITVLGEPIAERGALDRVLLEVEGPTALLTAATAYGYATVGLGALAVLIVIQLSFQQLLGGLWRSETRRREIAELSDVRRHLIAQLAAAEENERRRLATALHDEALQSLLVARQDLEELNSDGTDRARAAIEASIQQLRDEIFELHPVVLEGIGLCAAIEAMAESCSARGGYGANVTVEPAATGHHDVLLFTLARELLTNVTKHAGATRVGVSVRRRKDVIELEVTDDGRGIDSRQAQLAVGNGRIGLASSRERVRALGGRFDLEGDGRDGTTVHVVIPCDPEA
jgi:signal transduction histidine kinase